MVMRINRIDDNIVNAIKLSANYPSILKMGVYGSYARGEQTKESDIDILYDYDDTMINNMLSCLTDIEDHIKKKVDFTAYYLLFDDDLDEYGIDFKNNVLNDVIWIYYGK